MTDTDTLRGQLTARIQSFLAANYPCKCASDDPTCDREWPEAEHLADAVLAVVQPTIRGAQAEAWERGRRSAWAGGIDRRHPIWERSPNPYRDERSTDA